MDSNIKKELIEEIKQLDIKQEGVSVFPADGMPTAVFFCATFELSAAVTVNADRQYITVTDGVRSFYYRHNPQNMSCDAEFLPAKKAKISFGNLILQLQDSNGQTIDAGEFNVSIVFTDLVQCGYFQSQLIDAGYNLVAV